MAKIESHPRLGSSKEFPRKSKKMASQPHTTKDIQALEAPIQAILEQLRLLRLNMADSGIPELKLQTGTITYHTEFLADYVQKTVGAANLQIEQLKRERAKIAEIKEKIRQKEAAKAHKK